MQTPDGRQLAMDALAKVIPSCFTEAKGDDGELHPVVDFTKLRQLLGDAAVDDAPEVYDFTWVGKRAAMREAAAPIRKTLRPCPEESVDWDTTQNLYIEGDNLEVLKLLQNSYMGKVKMIYIDPPYNTGNDFVYQDDFHRSSQEEDEAAGVYNEEGQRLIRNTVSNGRFHSDWCSMMYTRLMVARSLLKEDGVIFISIDDREAENLIKMCNEIFGEQSFVTNISWQKTYSPRNDSKGIPAEKESIIVYGKMPGWTPKKLSRTEEMDSLYKNPDNDVTSWTSDNPCAPGAKTHQGMVYAIQHPFTGEMLYPYNGSCWRYQQDEMFSHMNGWCEYELRELDDARKRAEICGVDTEAVGKEIKAIVLKNPLEESKKQAERVLKRGKWPKFYFTKEGKGGIRRKTYLSEVEGRMVTNLWPFKEVGHTDEAKKELKALFEGDIPFDTPKPVRLISRIVEISTDDEDTVLDFFSGSASTAHAIIQTNKEKNSHRRFILVQIPEKIDNKYVNLCEVGKERIRRAGKKILKENTEAAADLDIGFRVFKCAESNYKEVAFTPKDYTQESLDLFVDNIKEGRSDLDLLFDCMLRWGVQLSMPLSTKKVDGCTIHNVDDGNLVACFDGTVTEKVIDAISAMSPVRVVFRDSSFTEASTKMNLYELFKQKCGWSDENVMKNIRVI